MPYDKKKQNAVYIRYHAKAYTRYALTFHNEQHKDIIEYFERQKKQGKSPTKTVVELLEKLEEKGDFEKMKKTLYYVEECSRYVKKINEIYPSCTYEAPTIGNERISELFETKKEAIDFIKNSNLKTIVSCDSYSGKYEVTEYMIFSDIFGFNEDTEEWEATDEEFDSDYITETWTNGSFPSGYKFNEKTKSLEMEE